MNVCCSENNTLAHQVTKECAKTVTIGRVVELAVQKYSKEEGQHLQALYNRVKGEVTAQKMVGAITIIYMHTSTLAQMVTACM